MKTKLPFLFTLLAIIATLTGFLATNLPASAQQPVVHAVLFYSPTCGHCEKVRNEVLPPLEEKYGSQLVIQQIDATQADGQALYRTAASQYNFSGVPALIIGDTALLGSVDIPNQLPGLIDEYLAQGGLDWPKIQGFSPPTTTPEPVTKVDLPMVQSGETASANPTQTGQDLPLWQQRFLKDPLANSLAVIMFAIMIVTLIAVAYTYVTLPENLHPLPDWVVPAICVLGIFVAAYLTYVEVTHSQAICGPVGNCNSVQQSPYARLFGFLPVGIFGMLGYLAIGGVWLIKRLSIETRQHTLTLLMWGLALFGVLFSAYLTFLEPFVIGATCAWCLTNALLITILLWTTTVSAVRSIQVQE